MSSFIGHALAALTVGETTKPGNAGKMHQYWRLWLVAAAWAPDLDYVFAPLNSANNHGLRLTHSIAYCLMLSLFAAAYLWARDRKMLVVGCLQTFAAGFSHLLLDALVGSRSGDPWFFPFSSVAINPPFGILPSSARLSPTNFYLYRNLLIECGVLVPAFCFILFFTGKLKLSKFSIAALLAVWTFFLVWSMSLKR